MVAMSASVKLTLVTVVVLERVRSLKAVKVEPLVLLVQ